MTGRQTADLPEGFHYRPHFLSLEEERAILDRMDTLPFGAVEMHGIVAKRRVLHFGWRYGYQSWAITPGETIPDWLLPLRERAAALMEVTAETIEEILLSQYPPGAGIGWHRDAPMFGSKVVGLSLLGPCRLRFQRQRQAVREVSECQLEPRSAYLLSGEARLIWQHAIPPTKVLRYSITFRTLKKPR